MLSVWTKLRRTLTAFAVARSGNVALTFAMATLPIIGGVGAAVDFSRANSIKTAMQTALDSTALMLAKEAFRPMRLLISRRCSTAPTRRTRRSP